MTDTIDLKIVSTTLQRLLEQAGRPLFYECRRTGDVIDITLESATSTTGLLPVFLSAADALWREATGKSLGAEIVVDPDTMLGFSVKAIRGGTFTAVMLSMMEAIEQASEFTILHVNKLAEVWERSEDRIRWSGSHT